MKKLLFSAFDMNVGGIETSLLTLLNYLSDRDYDITLVLEKKQGPFLRDLDNKIKLIEYTPSNYKVVFIRKLINLVKRILFIMKHKNKYDFSAAYSTYSRAASFTARAASKNCALWGHADYLALFKGDIQKVKEFFEVLHYNKFEHIVFVSKSAVESFTAIYPEMAYKTLFCNNLIDYKRIENLAQENAGIEKKTYTFVNVGRHDEQQKKLTRILEATKKLKQEGFDFRIWFIGDGKDHFMYEELVDKYDIQDRVDFLGMRKNPYPYMKLADSVILSSDYEGYPVVFLESFVLNKPIITTDISDSISDVENGYGKVVSKDTEAIYVAMKEFLENGYTIKKTFDPKRYNEEVIEKLESMIEH